MAEHCSVRPYKVRSPRSMESKASRTALGTSMMRAIHSRQARSPLIDDTWGDRLVPEAEQAAFRGRVSDSVGAETKRRLGAFGPGDAAVHAVLRASSVYGSVIIRTRYTEDALRAAVERGCRQLVILGAGFDSFALRRPAFAE